MTPEQKQQRDMPERTIDKMHRETGIPMWALDIAFELSIRGMLDEETMAGMRVIPDAAKVIAEHGVSLVKSQEKPDCWPDMVAVNREYHYTVMRSACVENVRDRARRCFEAARMIDHGEAPDTPKSSADYRRLADGLNEAADELESLSIEQPKG